MLHKKNQETENLSSLMKETRDKVTVLDKNLKTAIAIGTYKDTINTIVCCVAEHFDILQTSIINGKTQKFQIPRRITTCLIHYEVGISMRDISKYVYGKKHAYPVFQAIKAHRELDTKIKFDREYKEAYDAIFEKVKEKLNTKTE